jgi:fermentation-respiration switch protein FrsA (DUF1100 family)
MITISSETIDSIPILHIAKQTEFESPLPTVIFQHGFTSAKEHNLAYAYLLAEAGYRTLLPDAVYHGERESNVAKEKRNLSFWDIVVNGIYDIDKLIHHYRDRGLIDHDRIGMAGTSMGGIITFGALTQYPWIKAAVSLMGLPNFVAFSKMQLEMIKKEGLMLPVSADELLEKMEKLQVFDLTYQTEKLAGRPLMVWHSTIDQVVPYEMTKQFFDEIQSLYGDRPEKLKMITDSTSGHKVPREAVLQTVEWFKTHL